MSDSYLILAILVAALATFLTRLIPFLLFSKKKPSKTLKYVQLYTPLAIMIILVFYTLKDVSFITYPYALPEILGIVITFIVQIKFNKPLLSILVATICYMFFVQYLF